MVRTRRLPSLALAIEVNDTIVQLRLRVVAKRPRVSRDPQYTHFLHVAINEASRIWKRDRRARVFRQISAEDFAGVRGTLDEHGIRR